MSSFQSVIKRSKLWAKRALRPAIQSVGKSPSALAPSKWRLQDDSSRGLLLQGVALRDLIQNWGSPLHIVDSEALRNNIEAFRAPSKQTGLGCEVYYSYKTNPIPGVLTQLHALGVGAEVISHYELWLARRLGVPPERIVYNGPGKSTESIREAVSMGLQLINLNHPEEVQRIVGVARSIGARPRVGLRITTGDGWSAQFGTPTAGGVALAAYAQAQAAGVLDVVGLHAHLGGMIHSKERLLHAVDSVLQFVQHVESELGFTLEVLNFGGSLATPTVYHISARDKKLNQAFQRDLPEPCPRHSLAVDDYITCLTARVSDHYRHRERPCPRIFIEPGRSMTGNTQMLVASVITSKAERDTTYLILDAGINLAESVRNEYHHLFPVVNSSHPRTHTYTVVGPICSPGDTLYPTWRGPALSQGDAVVIMDAGAYFVPFSTSFSYPRPAIIALDHGQPKLLRRAERFEDIVAYDDLSEIG